MISCVQEKAENEEDVFDTNVCVKDVESLFVKNENKESDRALIILVLGF